MDKDEIPFSFKPNYFHSYLQYAQSIIASYHGAEPFHIFLKKYFFSNKKHGSKDRKIIASLCYNYFRLGFGVSIEINFTEKVSLSVFLCGNKSSRLLESVKPDWNASVSSPLKAKLEMVKEICNAEKIFPFNEYLSNTINKHDFNLSFLIQPKLFIRIRSGYKKVVLEKVKKAGFLFEVFNDDCIAFSNNEKVSDIIEIDKEAVIQDYNSQRSCDLLTSHILYHTSQISIWDCCAGSGGKSILAYDLFKNIQLTASDKRKNILDNLKQRFNKATIKNYSLLQTDLEKSVSQFNQSFDVIIADVPCTGSGTWTRTPEQLHFYNKKEIDKYALLQQKIIENALPALKPDGYLLYITCSVFAKENEENVNFIQQEYNLKLIEMKYLEGYQIQADTMFTALFKKNND